MQAKTSWLPLLIILPVMLAWWAAVVYLIILFAVTFPKTAGGIALGIALFFLGSAVRARREFKAERIRTEHLRTLRDGLTFTSFFEETVGALCGARFTGHSGRSIFTCVLPKGHIGDHDDYANRGVQRHGK